MKSDTLQINKPSMRIFWLVLIQSILLFGLAEGVSRLDSFQTPLTPPKIGSSHYQLGHKLALLNTEVRKNGLMDCIMVGSSIVILAWVPFRWELPVAFDFWRALLNWSVIGIGYRRLLLVLPILFGSLLIDFLQYRSQDEFIFLKWSPLARATCMAAILLFVFIVTGGDFEQPFVYQAF